MKRRKENEYFDCLDDVRGLVYVTISERINEAARDQASHQQLLRVFVKFLTEYGTPMKYLAPKHVGVICNGKNLNTSSSLSFIFQ